MIFEISFLERFFRLPWNSSICENGSESRVSQDMRIGCRSPIASLQNVEFFRQLYFDNTMKTAENQGGKTGSRHKKAPRSGGAYGQLIFHFSGIIYLFSSFSTTSGMTESSKRFVFFSRRTGFFLCRYRKSFISLLYLLGGK